MSGQSGRSARTDSMIRAASVHTSAGNAAWSSVDHQPVYQEMPMWKTLGLIESRCSEVGSWQQGVGLGADRTTSTTGHLEASVRNSS